MILQANQRISKECGMQVFHFLAGALILLFGRPLYWALVAVLGFVIGFDLVQDLALADSQAMQVLIAIGAGILAAALAVAFQWLAFGLVGFLAGSFLLQAAIERFEITAGNETMWYLIGGVVGAVVGLMLADWAVIVLSALAGAMMITNQIELEEQTRGLILVGLAIVGVVFQRRQLNRKTRQH